MENTEARDDRDQMPENDNHNMEALLAQQGDIDFRVRAKSGQA